ncbi:uncharacterized protein PITG_07342 [Phytophthora infestans T30-4]|uniref:Uncharacterized protein n=1 Tax=Phytophthora infestans (strain T30-4) TaxID=403677 RepID=D0N7V3_PHYIT|nr:uncharacterized protein PITG_07342 [Phytophthora infestans T30-4]EEY53652.1 conserved hypothetical protein [Phytophthora infestans T30-4]|eukprot:XP_002905270.1 conserved hypothetical protein [Phytophthora infestans T30-4]
MDESKRQPEEHEVLAEIHSVISNNPEFGSKRVASSIKGSNPDWHIGDKRGSSPWNVAPAATSTNPEAASPWAVSPFQTSNPFKSPDTSSPPAETEPEPDVVSSARP